MSNEYKTKYFRVWNKNYMKNPFQIGSCDIWIMQETNEMFNLCSEIHKIKGQQHIHAHSGDFYDFELENAVTVTKESYSEVLIPILNGFLASANETRKKIEAMTPDYVTLPFEDWLSLKYNSLGSCVQYSTIRHFGEIPKFSELYEAYRNAYHSLCKNNCAQDRIKFDCVWELVNNCEKDGYVNYMNR